MSEASDPIFRLRCSKCGVRATADDAARPGGTHYVRHAGIRGRNNDYFSRVVSCGTWAVAAAVMP